MEIKKYTYPFDYYIIDGFANYFTARQLSKDFFPYDSDKWFEYDNPLEKKKTIREWGMFPPTTYRFFSDLCSPDFVAKLRHITKCSILAPDHGLHGAGWHIHKTGDHLNIHLDYAMHPKLYLQRKFNLILYLNEEWEDEWGGDLELWTHDADNNKPKFNAVKIKPKFNRAVLFDTTQNSWHGFSEKIKCPQGVYRKSIAMYYLTIADLNMPFRTRALYAPTKDQENDKQILELIKQRSQ